jgi:hypothetical protein
MQQIPAGGALESLAEVLTADRLARAAAELVLERGTPG